MSEFKKCAIISHAAQMLVNRRNCMKKTKRIIFLCIGLIVLSFAVPIIINELYKLNSGYETIWGAADTLSFYGALIGAIGTIVLGIVSWQQNARLVKLEENSFIAQNACSILIEKIEFSGFKQLAVDFTQHEEQILQSESDISFPNCASLEIKYYLNVLDGIPALINVSSLMIHIKDYENNTVLINFSNSDASFSRVAISEKYACFKTTLIMNRDQKNQVISLLEDFNSELMIETQLSVMTDKYVVTKLKCRSKMDCNGLSELEEETNNLFCSEPDKTLCFWFGNEIVNKEEVEIKTRLNEL